MTYLDFAPPNPKHPSHPADNMAEGKTKLLDEVRDRIRFKHYSIRTEECYVEWIGRFIVPHDRQHPASLNATHVAAFLTHRTVVAACASWNACGEVYLPFALARKYPYAVPRPPVQVQYGAITRTRNRFSEQCAKPRATAPFGQCKSYLGIEMSARPCLHPCTQPRRGQCNQSVGPVSVTSQTP